MNVFIVPAVGGVFVARGDEETFRPMTAVAMMTLAERLIVAARDTIRAETELTESEIVHALR